MDQIEFIEEEFQIKPALKNTAQSAPQNTDFGSLKSHDFTGDFKMSQRSNSIPLEIIKSTTVESLLSQNEDLMARLKVTLRRLSILEVENQKIQQESQRTSNHYNVMSDQIMILKEKENNWRVRFEDLEVTHSMLQEKNILLLNSVTQLQTETERYKKYHEKIKTTVKPFIQDLKSKLTFVEKNYETLEKKLSLKEAQLRDVRAQIGEVTKNSQEQIEIMHKKNSEAFNYYETQIQQLSEELRSQLEMNKTLEQKSLRLHQALEKQDELENEVIFLTRHKEEIKIKLESEILRLQEKNNEFHRQLTKFEYENTDLGEKIISEETRAKKLQKENADLTQQIDNLRFMWNAKNQETDSLKSAMTALEALNVSLSQKISTQRQEL